MAQNIIDKSVNSLQKDVNILQEDAKQITPLPQGAKVGQTFKVKSINEDGSYVMEPISLFDQTIRQTNISLLGYLDKACLIRWGNVVWFSYLTDINQLATGWTYSVGTIPKGYKPKVSLRYFYTVPQPMQFLVRDNGQIDIYNYGTAVNSTKNGGFTICWITADA